MAEDQSGVWKAVSSLLTATRAAPFRAHVTMTMNGPAQDFEVHVDPARLEWDVRHDPSGIRRTFTHSAGYVHVDGFGRRSDESRHDFVPPITPVWLAFPLQLPIWGRPSDDWSPSLVSDNDGSATITFIHRRESGVDALLLIESRAGVVRTFRSHYLELEMYDLEPAGPVG